MTPNPNCTIEKFTATISARHYIEHFRRADFFLQFCRQCPNFARRHGCPPLDHDPLNVIGRYNSVRIIGVKVTPTYKLLPLSQVNELLQPVTLRLNEELLAAEEQLHGHAYGFVGSCPYCGDEPCARLQDKPCRHPDKVRPSLEAIGFDIQKTASDLLGIEIKWGIDGFAPQYLTLVCGLFYNNHD